MCCSTKGLLVTVGALFGALFLLGIVLLGVGDVLRVDAAHSVTLHGHQWSSCTLTRSAIDRCDNASYVVVYESSGTSVVASPFALYRTTEEAQRHVDDYPLNVAVPCACDPAAVAPWPYVDCARRLSNACMLDAAIVAYVQKTGTVYAYSGDSTIGVGVVVFLIAFASIVIVVTAACVKRFKSNKVSTDYTTSGNDV